MKRFSERRGLKKVRTKIQVDSMDEALRNRLWNVLDYYYWGRGKLDVHLRALFEKIEGRMASFFLKLWHSYFKKPVHSLSLLWSRDLPFVSDHFFGCEWYEVYDFIEFSASAYPDEATNKKFIETCNKVLEEELSGYRFIGTQIVPITSEEEISEIEEALETPLTPVKTHLVEALRLLSDRKSPDCRNSIKESISAVEAICRLITKNDKATLGQALKEVETKIGLHGALKKGFSNLYGYTSSAEGIRHALLKESSLSFEDAKFMLVSCSAFINYLISKASKAGIQL